MSEVSDADLARRLELCRSEGAQARIRINGGPWKLVPGAEFLKLWETPFAGTIDIDRVVVPSDS